MVIAVMVAIGSAAAGGYWQGSKHTKDRLESQMLREEVIAQQVYNSAIEATAEEIGKIRITNRTIREQLETQIRYEPVYIDCRHNDDVKRLLDAILVGEEPAESFDRSILSILDTAD